MKIQQFLAHHSIVRNPFAEEDARTDPVFKDCCIASTYHPTWDKVYGDPREPATAIVFGEKGSGKTALRLQIARHLREHNQAHPDQQVLVIHYDDFNPFLDRFRDRFGIRRRRPDRLLAEWRLADHIDAILSLAITGLVDRILAVKQPSSTIDAELHVTPHVVLDRYQVRDLLLLSACYDQSHAEPFPQRWRLLRRHLRFRSLRASLDLTLGCTAALLIGVLALVLAIYGQTNWLQPAWLWLVAAAGCFLPFALRAMRCLALAWNIACRTRVIVRNPLQLWRVLLKFHAPELLSQPLPGQQGTEARYEMLVKLQSALQTLGLTGIVVLVDRVDEPHLINGSAELMRALIWPMLDNKFLKHPGLGLKLMLPIELRRFIERADREFYQRARLDKQNVISKFEWTAESLWDVAAARLRACSDQERSLSLRAFFADTIPDARLRDALRSLRTPRHLFRFLYRLLVNHCNAHTDDRPCWKIEVDNFEATLAVYLREQDAFDRGVGAG